MHPRERRTTRRQFLFASGGTIAAISGADGLIRAADAFGATLSPPLMGPGGIPLARRDHPVTLPIYSGNEPIASGKSPERGPLQVFNWADYINPQVVKDFEKAYKVQVRITTFENEEEALAKLTSGQAGFDVWFPTVDYLSRAVAGKLVQPLNHHYLPNLKNVWASLQSPFYDVRSQYTVPYVIYTTGIAWRNDKVKTAPTSFANPYDAFWHGHPYSGKVAILDDQREALALALLHRHVGDVNTESKALVNRAASYLKQLTGLVNVKTNVNDYTDLPAWKTWLTQAWSGDMAGVSSYMPKGLPVDVISYWRPQKHAVVGSDMITVLRGAKNPVLAHHFLNFVLDNKRGLENLSWLGYIPPLKVVDPARLVAQGYIPKNLESTVVRESDFKHGLTLLPLTTQGQSTWQDAWSAFKAG
ncbi:MAG: polyamine ABC transporter substrate-binding protein [Gaiellaceae bacterium]